MPKTTTTTKSKVTTLAISSEVKNVLEQTQERLSTTLGFKPTLGQTLTHVLTKEKTTENA